jgi:hypothetical protein
MNLRTLTHLTASAGQPVVSIAGGDLSELLDSYRSLRVHSLNQHAMVAEASGCMVRILLQNDQNGRIPWLVQGHGWFETGTSADAGTALSEARDIIARSTR